MREKIESENSNGDFNINYGLVFGFIGTAVAIASLYYNREEYKREDLQPVTIKMKPEKEPINIEPKNKQPENILDNLE